MLDDVYDGCIVHVSGTGGVRRIEVVGGRVYICGSGRVKGGYGCVLVARNIEYSEENKRYEVADWACTIVDGKDIKPDTWYRLKDGKLVEDND